MTGQDVHEPNLTITQFSQSLWYVKISTASSWEKRHSTGKNPAMFICQQEVGRKDYLAFTWYFTIHVISLEQATTHFDKPTNKCISP